MRAPSVHHGARVLRRLLALLVLCAGAAAGAQAAPAIVVPFTPGGSTDRIARALAAGLAETPTGRLVVENRPGGDGLIAVEQVLQKTERPGALLMVTGYFVVAQADGRLPAEKALRFKPVAHIGHADIYLVAGQDARVRTVSDLTTGAVRDRPLACAASAGFLSAVCDSLARDHPKRIVSVPYRGESQALNDLLGGHVDFMPVTRPLAEPSIDAGAVKLLVNLSKPAAPGAVADLPDVFRAGLRSLFAVMVADDMPDAAVRALNQDINQVLKSAAFRETARALGVQTAGGTERDLERVLRESVATQVQLVRGPRQAVP